MLHIEYETQDKGSVLYTMAIQQNFIKQKYCEKASHGFVFFFLNMPSIYNGMVMKNMKKKHNEYVLQFCYNVACAKCSF